MELSVLRILVALNVALIYHGSEGLPAPLFADNHDNFTSPLEHMTTPQIIKYYGYVCEIHHVTTKDGYILELHRIPHGKNSNKSTKGVAFVQHGLIDSSFTWIANAPNQSLGYILADRGYDVWLGNSRGNTYSREHTRLQTDQQEFWEFSFDEMAKYDNPAAIDYILKLTGEKQVNYIGHSQGTMIGFAGFSAYPALARKIKLFVALAPVTHVYHMKGLMAFLSHGSWLAKKVLDVLGTKNFMPNSWVVKTVGKLLCKGMSSTLCEGMIFLMTGFDAANLNSQRLPVYISHTPAGTSMRDIWHFAQLAKTDKFQMYDHGWNENMRKYLQPYPPPYDVSKMNVPCALFVGESDWLATEQDISINLRNKLPNVVYDQDIDGWNHMDFVWGTHANTVLYANVLSLLDGKQPYADDRRP